MNLGLSHKHAVVTGAGRGIGRAIALALAAEGAVVTVVSRTKNDLDRVVEEMGGKKNGHRAFVADLTRDGAPRKIAGQIQRSKRQVDILVNNLGDTLNIRDPFCSLAQWRRVWRINVEVAIECNNNVIPAMKKSGWGRIVNISSISGLENQGPVPYCTAKAALIAYTRSMGRVLAPTGIIMTSVLPGAVITKDGYWDQVSKTNPGHVTAYLRDRMAIGRFGQPEEIAPLVTFLCSQHASFCIGTAVVVDGGQGRTFTG